MELKSKTMTCQYCNVCYNFIVTLPPKTSDTDTKSPVLKYRINCPDQMCSMALGTLTSTTSPQYRGGRQVKPSLPTFTTFSHTSIARAAEVRGRITQFRSKKVAQQNQISRKAKIKI